MLSDNQSYITLIGEGDKLLSGKKYSESINKYEQAQIYEKKYTGTEYSKEFDKRASSKIEAAKEAEREAAAEYAKYKGHEWVDLGLPSGIKWATCNVGASRPEEYGDYFAWGETTTKETYTEANCATYNVSMNDISGNAQYDAATANWGGSWRMPTKNELNELINNCTWTWTTQNGVNGYNVEGPNGNSIFLPAAGDRLGPSLYCAGIYGIYWSSTPYENDGGYGAYYFGFENDSHHMARAGRYYGQSVRPVLE